MPELVKDRWYYESMSDADLREAVRGSDHSLAQVVYERWANAHDEYADDHAREVDALERELDALERELTEKIRR